MHCKVLRISWVPSVLVYQNLVSHNKLPPPPIPPPSPTKPPPPAYPAGPAPCRSIRIGILQLYDPILRQHLPAGTSCPGHTMRAHPRTRYCPREYPTWPDEPKRSRMGVASGKWDVGRGRPGRWRLFACAGRPAVRSCELKLLHTMRVDIEECDVVGTRETHTANRELVGCVACEWVPFTALASCRLHCSHMHFIVVIAAD